MGNTAICTARPLRKFLPPSNTPSSYFHTVHQQMPPLFFRELRPAYLPRSIFPQGCWVPFLTSESALSWYFPGVSQPGLWREKGTHLGKQDPATVRWWDVFAGARLGLCRLGGQSFGAGIAIPESGPPRLPDRRGQSRERATPRRDTRTPRVRQGLWDSRGSQETSRTRVEHLVVEKEANPIAHGIQPQGIAKPLLPTPSASKNQPLLESLLEESPTFHPPSCQGPELAVEWPAR